jgi:hypothetical protein
MLSCVVGRAGLGRAFAHSGFNLSSFSIISFRSAVNLRRRRIAQLARLHRHAVCRVQLRAPSNYRD